MHISNWDNRANEAYHAARHEACAPALLQGSVGAFVDAIEAYDGAGSAMPAGGLDDIELGLVLFADWLDSLKA
jgi:hypothetical protein